jgi:hypothetical protein
MISGTALHDFKAVWRSEFGEDISDETAMDEATNLLSIFSAIYRPIKQEWIDEYENGNQNVVKILPISASSKSGAEK